MTSEVEGSMRLHFLEIKYLTTRYKLYGNYNSSVAVSNYRQFIIPDMYEWQ